MAPLDDDKESRIAERVVELKRLQHLAAGVVGEFSPIRNEEEIEVVEEALARINAGDKAYDLSGEPETDDEFMEHTLELCNAMTNLVGIDEATAVPADADGNGPGGKDSTAVALLKSKKAWEIDLLAAKFMKAIREAQSGRIVLGSKSAQAQECGNFTVRFQAVVDALTVSKLLVKSAFVGGDDWIHRIAVNPAEELRLKRNNKTVNASKAETLKLGAEAKKKKNPKADSKDTNEAATAMSPSAPAVPPSPEAQAPSNEQDSSAPSGGRRMETDATPEERPQKRARAQFGKDNDGKDTPVLETDSMGVPGPVQGRTPLPSGRRGTQNTSHLRNASGGVHTAGTVKAEVEAEVKAEDDVDISRIPRFGF